MQTISFSKGQKQKNKISVLITWSVNVTSLDPTGPFQNRLYSCFRVHLVSSVHTYSRFYLKLLLSAHTFSSDKHATAHGVSTQPQMHNPLVEHEHLQVSSLPYLVLQACHMPAAGDILRPGKNQTEIRPAAAATVVLNPPLSSSLSFSVFCRSKQHVRVAECMGSCVSVRMQCRRAGLRDVPVFKWG